MIQVRKFKADPACTMGINATTGDMYMAGACTPPLFG
jgi:hypothetical protein